MCRRRDLRPSVEIKSNSRTIKPTKRIYRMKRINDLHPQTRLDMIEESRWQFGHDHVQHCINTNAEINGMCDWSKTRQGAHYWALIDSGAFDPVMN